MWYQGLELGKLNQTKLKSISRTSKISLNEHTSFRNSTPARCCSLEDYRKMLSKFYQNAIKMLSKRLPDSLQ